MKRLIELPDDDRLTARAHVLVRALGPTVESEERLLRVRRSLDAPVRATAPRWVWRAGLAFGLLGATAAAAAATGAFSDDLAESPAAPVSGPRGEPAAVASPAMPRVAPAPPAVVAAAPEAPDAPVSEPPSPRSNARAPKAAAPPLSDVARVHEAAKALRHDSDPERALQLLERPGTTVTGPLAEEALALRIEASLASGDGRAAKLATAYLAQYPNGRYRELAKKALAGPGR